MSASKVIVALHFHTRPPDTETIDLLGEALEIRHLGCDGDLAQIRQYIDQFDGQVDAIALVGVVKTLHLAGERVTHEAGAALFAPARTTPLVDGSGVCDALERWAVRLAADVQPGLWSRKRVLMVPGLNHSGLTQALAQYTEDLRYADPIIYYAMPDAPGIGRPGTMQTTARVLLGQLRHQPFNRIFPRPGQPRRPRSPQPFAWADVLAGDIGAIRRYAPPSLKHKIIVVPEASQADIDDLTGREALMLVTTMPPLPGPLSSHGPAIFEACLAALRVDPDAPLTENTYLNLMANLTWQPGIQVLQPAEAAINRFAFVIHPLSVSFIHQHPAYHWTRFLPGRLVERVAAYLPPLYLGRITGIESPTTGQKVEGSLLALGGTPRELMRHEPGFVYRRLIRAARMAERLGARLMGLGAFTSVVGDAGITVAQKADIAITSGNSLTVAATLETAKQAVVKMGNSLDKTHEGTAMVVGATGSIGSVCSRLIAQAEPKTLILVAPRPERLIQLKRTIEAETPQASVIISTAADDYIGQADLIVTTTTALNTRILDIRRCKPGAVICDIARPPDISAAENALRPDVLVIESGEILLPGRPDFGYNIGLPPGVAYACLAETALLAMEGRFEDYTLGRNIEIERVKEIYRLYKKHQLQLSGMRSHGHFLSDDELAHKRALSDELKRDPQRLAALAEQPFPAALDRRPTTAASGRPLLAVGIMVGALLIARLVRRVKSDKDKTV